MIAECRPSPASLGLVMLIVVNPAARSMSWYRAWRRVLSGQAAGSGDGRQARREAPGAMG